MMKGDEKEGLRCAHWTWPCELDSGLGVKYSVWVWWKNTATLQW